MKGLNMKKSELRKKIEDFIINMDGCEYESPHGGYNMRFDTISSQHARTNIIEELTFILNLCKD